jgi:acyl carrier protein
MTDSEIKEIIFKLLKEIAPEADFSELTPNENIREVLDIDSFDFLNFLIGINAELGIDIPESDYGQLRTLAEIVSYISARVNLNQ